MSHSLTRIYLVAQREDGKFLALDETFGATSPHYVDTPQEAKKINLDAIPKEPLHPPTYYFENSYRAREWVENCKMVIIVDRSEATVNELPGSEYHRDMELQQDRKDRQLLEKEMDEKGIKGFDRLSHSMQRYIERRLNRTSPFIDPTKI